VLRAISAPTASALARDARGFWRTAAIGRMDPRFADLSGLACKAPSALATLFSTCRIVGANAVRKTIILETAVERA